MSERQGVFSFLKARWGGFFWSTVLVTLLLATAAVVVQVRFGGEELVRSLTLNLGPILLLLLLLVLMGPTVIAYGLRLQRDDMRRTLDGLNARDTGTPRFDLRPRVSEKVGRTRYSWLTQASVRHEMKLDLVNDSSSGLFQARAYWSDGSAWNLPWYGSTQESVEIAGGADATLIVALVALRRGTWDAFGVLPGFAVGPRAPRDSKTVAIRVDIRRSGGAAASHTLQLRYPDSEEGRPTLELV